MKKFNLYKPGEDAAKVITERTREAKAAGKHVFIQVGGNWCVWCARFYEFCGNDSVIRSIFNQDYIVYHLNSSKENRNEEILAGYGYPQRFGFPVFLILNGEGRLLHTQNSVYLEEGSGYNREKVVEFLKHWAPRALDPATYKE